VVLVLAFMVSIFSVVKEEIIDDDAHLPCFNGRVVSWVSTWRDCCHLYYLGAVVTGVWCNTVYEIRSKTNVFTYGVFAVGVS